jgi:hypothetical protein
MESEHLIEFPERAVAPGPSVGKERKRGRGAPAVSSSRGYLRADTSLHRPASPFARPRANLSRTLWRSNTSGSCTAAPRGTGCSSSPLRHSLRLHGFLLRPSTAGVHRPAFGALRLPSEVQLFVQLFAPASISYRPSRLSVLKGSETESHQGPRRRIPARHTPDGRGALSSPGATGVSRNHGHAHAAQPNPSMQRTRCARR